MEREVRIEDIPEGMKFGDYPEDTVFIFRDDEEDDDWYPKELKKDAEDGGKSD